MIPQSRAQQVDQLRGKGPRKQAKTISNPLRQLLLQKLRKEYGSSML